MFSLFDQISTPQIFGQNKSEAREPEELVKIRQGELQSERDQVILFLKFWTVMSILKKSVCMYITKNVRLYLHYIKCPSVLKKNVSINIICRLGPSNKNLNCYYNLGDLPTCSLSKMSHWNFFLAKFQALARSSEPAWLALHKNQVGQARQVWSIYLKIWIWL